ncbi:unnamed protein product [Angiostrongylus costaricensis]|uniref:SAM domain-containing protein n=1 Tax=Angiostrongylus costaricensis TaxID=334426 RepID=A0A158PM18_ANGCS|nr:unnamed protein product [Angiostrongylus costaricensis]
MRVIDKNPFRKYRGKCEWVPFGNKTLGGWHLRLRRAAGITSFYSLQPFDDGNIDIGASATAFTATAAIAVTTDVNDVLEKLWNSCPDLEMATALPSSSDNRGQRRRNRRAKEKMKEACWRRKPLETNAFLLQEWALDDVLLWLQACNLDDVASLFIGYDLRGTDLLSWDHHCLCKFVGMVLITTSDDAGTTHLGVTSASIREKILDELATIRERGPDDMRETEKRTGHRALFDIVKQSSYDQVLAVETPLTTCDIIVTHGRLGYLQITKVNGVNLPLRENDCLLEINDCPGEQFKSALMLTKLISDANGVPIRFVVLRMKAVDRVENGSVFLGFSRNGMHTERRIGDGFANEVDVEHVHIDKVHK